MQKLAKQIYYKRNGEKAVNCYKVYLPKEIVKKANISEEDGLNVYEKKGKIIIEKEQRK